MNVEFDTSELDVPVKIGDLLRIEGRFYQIRRGLNPQRYYIANLTGHSNWTSDISWESILANAKKHQHFSQDHFKLKVEKI